MEILYLALPCYYRRRVWLACSFFLCCICPLHYSFYVLIFLFSLFLRRLSIPNMEDLKRRILKIVSNCNKPKVITLPCRVMHWHLLTTVNTVSLYLVLIYLCFFLSVSQYRILLQGCWYELFGGDPDDFPTEMDNRREEELSQPLLGEESLMIRHSSSYQSLASDDSPAHKAAYLPLFLPGRILHITDDGPSRRYVFKGLFVDQLKNNP